MNRSAAVLVILGIAALASCERRVQMQPREDMPQTQHFKNVLESGAVSGPQIFSLKVSPVKRQGRIYLFCRLRNVSNQPVRIDEAYLPWNTLGMMSAIAFDSHGQQLRTNLSLGGIFTEGSYDDIAVGDELTGSIDLEEFLYAAERPWVGDVTLRWVYVPRIQNQTVGLPAVTGDTVLPMLLR